MLQAFGLNIPQTLDDVCDPSSLALIVYEMQVGIVKQEKDGAQITAKVQQVLNAARAASVAGGAACTGSSTGRDSRF